MAVQSDIDTHVGLDKNHSRLQLLASATKRRVVAISRAELDSSTRVTDGLGLLRTSLNRSAILNGMRDPDSSLRDTGVVAWLRGFATRRPTKSRFRFIGRFAG